MNRSQEEWQAYYAEEGHVRRLRREWHALLVFARNVAVGGAMCSAWYSGRDYGDACCQFIKGEGGGSVAEWEAMTWRPGCNL